MSSYQNFVKLIIKCLNPYYNGKYSMSLNMLNLNIMVVLS